MGKDPKNEEFTLEELEALSDSGRIEFGHFPSKDLLIKDCRNKQRELLLLAELESYDLDRELTDKVKDMIRTCTTSQGLFDRLKDGEYVPSEELHSMVSSFRDLILELDDEYLRGLYGWSKASIAQMTSELAQWLDTYSDRLAEDSDTLMRIDPSFLRSVITLNMDCVEHLIGRKARKWRRKLKRLEKEIDGYILE